MKNRALDESSAEQPTLRRSSKTRGNAQERHVFVLAKGNISYQQASFNSLQMTHCKLCRLTRTLNA